MRQEPSLNPAQNYSSQPKLQKHYRIGEVAEVTGHAVASIYRLMSEGKFPRPIKISERSVAWPENVLVAYMAEREAA